MKTSVPWIVCSACICLWSATVFAQAGYGTPSGDAGSTLTYNTQLRAAQTNTPNEQFFHARSLVGQEIKDAKGGRTLGSVYDIAFNPQSGDTFIAIGVGTARYALVPWQALRLTGVGGRYELTLNTKLEDLQSGPTITSSDWDKLNNPDFRQSIYACFNLQPPIALGGTESNDLGGKSVGGGSSTITDTNRVINTGP